jgi:dipeptidase
MTKSLSAGAFGNPNRPRPLDWEYDEKSYSFERPISTYNTAFSYVAQMRNYLPDEIGGIAWYGVDDTYTSCYFPLYCQSTSVPAAFSSGDINSYSRESAWWVFNFVANYAGLRYTDMLKDIRLLQKQMEQHFLNNQDSVEQTALKLDKNERIEYLDDYSNVSGQLVHRAWLALGDYLVMKYNDGYVKDSAFRIRSIGYPEDWLKRIAEIEQEKYMIPE